MNFSNEYQLVDAGLRFLESLTQFQRLLNAFTTFSDRPDQRISPSDQASSVLF